MSDRPTRAVFCVRCPLEKLDVMVSAFCRARVSMSSELPPSGELHIPLHAEDLTVSKLTVAGDMVRVRTVTREHETFVDEALNHERGADRTKTDWPSGRSHSAARSAGRRYDNTSGGGRNPRHRAPPYSERRSSYPATACLGAPSRSCGPAQAGSSDHPHRAARLLTSGEIDA